MSYKLFFRYGAMGSSTSMNLLMTAHNYEVQDKNVFLIKPKLDNRDDPDMIVSRTGAKKKVDLLVDELTDIGFHFSYKTNHSAIKFSCILVDESQFLEPCHIDQLRLLSIRVPVICYGLRTDFRTKLFPASKRLLEIADNIEEVKTTCVNCNHKAIINAKFRQAEGKIILREGDQIEIGGDDLYQPMCWKCWTMMLCPTTIQAL